MSDDNKVKLLRIQSSLLLALKNEKDKLTPGSLAYEQIRTKIEDNLTKYKKLVTEIDRGIYHELQNKIQDIANSSFTYEQELVALEELEQFYNQYISIQNSFKNTYNIYEEGDMKLSPMDDLNINYYLKRKKTIKSYLDNKKKISELKKYISEYNEKLFAQEQTKLKVDKAIISLDEELKRKIQASEGRIINKDGNLKYTSIKNEFANNKIVLTDEGIEESEYEKIKQDANDAQSKLNVAIISYDALPSPDKKTILNDIKLEALTASYKLVLAKIIKAIFTPSKNYDDAIEKREHLNDLLKYRKKYLDELNIKYGIDPFSGIKIQEQIEKLKLFDNINDDMNDLKKKLSQYNVEIEELQTENEKNILDLNEFYNRPERQEQEEISFNNFKDQVKPESTVSLSTANSFILYNQVIEIKPSNINFKRVQDKARNVSKRVISILNRDNIKDDNVNPELVIEQKQETNDDIFKDENPFINDNKEDLFVETEPFTYTNNGSDANIFTNEDPFLDDNKEELFTETEPFIYNNNGSENDIFSNEDPFIDDNKEEDLFSEIKPFEDPTLYQNKIEEAEMPDMDMFLDMEPVSSRGGR